MIAEPIIPPAIAQAKGLKNILVKSSGRNPPIVVLSHIKESNANSPITKETLVDVVIRSTRHVITTSATTIGGFLPLLLTSVFFQPLAWAMAGGIIGSAIIALFYIPACYAISKKL